MTCGICGKRLRAPRQRWQGATSTNRHPAGSKRCRPPDHQLPFGFIVRDTSIDVLTLGTLIRPLEVM